VIGRVADNAVVLQRQKRLVQLEVGMDN